MAYMILPGLALFAVSATVFLLILRKKNKALRSRFRENALLYEFLQQVNRVLELEELCEVVDVFVGDRLGFGDYLFEIGEEKDKVGYRKISRGTADSRRQGGNFVKLPLIFKMKVVGSLHLFRPGRSGIPGDEQRFLSTLAGELAIALENVRLHTRTRELAVRDDLTGLYNRRHLQEILPMEIKRAQRFREPLSLLMLDIDFFKTYNDRYGHLAGDERLREFARLVASRVREVDFFARFGGEEFVVLLPASDAQAAMEVARQIQQAIQALALPHEGAPFGIVTVSFGAASLVPQRDQAPEELVRRADRAMYRAKQAGRNRIELAPD